MKSIVLLQLLTCREAILHSCFIGEGDHSKIANTNIDLECKQSEEANSNIFVSDED